MIFFVSIFLGLLPLINMDNFEWGSDYCTFDPKLQLVFIVQCSNMDIIKSFKEISKIAEDLQNQYPESKFAVAKFSDYPQLHKNPEGCYLRHQNFTTSTKAIEISSSTIEYLPSGNIESSGSALLYSAVDLSIGWSNDKYSQRILVLITNDYSHKRGVSSPHRKGVKPPVESKGDGTDTCYNNFSPDLNFVGEKLRNLNVSLFGMLRRGVRSNLEAYWKKMATENFKIPYDSIFIDKSNNTAILKKLVGFIGSLNREFVTCMDPPGYNSLGY